MVVCVYNILVVWFDKDHLTIRGDVRTIPSSHPII